MIGEEVTVLSRRQTGADPMGDPTWEWVATPVAGCLVRPVTATSDPANADATRPEAVRADFSVAFPKGYAGPPLRGCWLALTGRGRAVDPERPTRGALRVIGSPEPTRPCPTRWDMLAEAVAADG